MPKSHRRKVAGKVRRHGVETSGIASPSVSVPTGRVSSSTIAAAVALATTAFGPSSSIWNTPVPEVDRRRVAVAVGIRHRLHQLQQVGVRQCQRLRYRRRWPVLACQTLFELRERHLSRSPG